MLTWSVYGDFTNFLVYAQDYFVLGAYLWKKFTILHSLHLHILGYGMGINCFTGLISSRQPHINTLSIWYSREMRATNLHWTCDERLLYRLGSNNVSLKRTSFGNFESHYELEKLLLSDTSSIVTSVTQQFLLLPPFIPYQPNSNFTNNCINIIRNCRKI